MRGTWSGKRKLGVRSESPRRTKSSWGRGVEALEDRRLFALTGVALDAFPDIAYSTNSAFDPVPPDGYAVTYDAGEFVVGGGFDADATPFVAKFSEDGFDEFVFPAIGDSSPDLRINIVVASDGSLVGGVAGDDFIIRGRTTDSDTDTTYGTATGILLSGEIERFGWENTAATDSDSASDTYDFVFRPTGGELLPLYGDRYIGVTLNSTNSTFNEDFSQDFRGFASGDVAPVEVSSLSGYVYHDVDDDGVRDAGEAPIPGTTVSLSGTDVDGRPVSRSTTTDATGFYEFRALWAGTYTVTETQPVPDWLDGKDTAGSHGGTAGNDVISAINLPAGVDAVEYNFGELKPAALGNFVWHDLDADGQQDVDEPGVDGVTVNLLDSDGDLIGTTVTDLSGLYAFTGLRPGTYSVQFDQPGGFTFTVPNSGADTTDSDAALLTGNTAQVTLASGETNNTLDAGLVAVVTALPASIGNFVWEDANANGLQDTGEPGIDGATVRLRGAGGSVVATTLTAGGNYLFSGLAPGQYSVEFVLPGGYVFTSRDVGGDDGIDSDAETTTGRTVDTTLVAGETDLTWDAGVYRPASLGDFVWKDVNANGIQDAGEPGISSVTVKLFDGTNTQVATATTNASGLYLFSGLKPGSYSVEFGLLAGYTRSPKDVGSDTTDSDADPATGKTGVYVLASGDVNLSVDAGMYKRGSIGGTKWLDCTGNGLSPDDTTPMSGVTIQLYSDMNGDGKLNAGDVFITDTQTLANGTYSFGNLADGKYLVKEVVPANYVRTAPTLLDYHAVTVSGGNNVNKLDFANYLKNCVNCCISNVCFVVNGCDIGSDLRGKVKQGDQVCVKFTINAGCAPTTVSLVSYKAPSGVWDPNVASQQTVFQQKTDTFKPGNYQMCIEVPNCYFQVDFVCGKVIDKLGPAGSNIFYSAQGRLISADNGGVQACTDQGSSISGRVFRDRDNDGVIDTGTYADTGIAGVTVKLSGKDCFGRLVNLVRITDANGRYCFSDLRKGTYTIVEVQPPGYLDGKDVIGTIDGIKHGSTSSTKPDTISNIVLDWDEDAINYNFAELKN
jgi:hypothetical protein